MKQLRDLLACFYLLLATSAIVFLPSVIEARQDHLQAIPTAQEAAPHPESTTMDHETGMPEEQACHFHHDADDKEYDATNTAFHHISDANVYSIGSFNFPLPCILYSKGQGWDVFSSSRFAFERFGHGEGHKAYNRYVLDEGAVKHVQDATFPMGEVDIEGFHREEIMVNGEKRVKVYVCYAGSHYLLEAQSTADGGLFGGGITNFYDFSLTKNVVSMLIIGLLLFWAFTRIARAYQTRNNMAPTGLQSFMEPIFLFIQDEVAKPFLGPKWERFLPLLLSLFFFILGLNLFSQIPIFGGSNVTGNLAVTAVLALITFVVVTINGNKQYWSHIVWMPGVPAIIKILILTPVEILGMFIKPFTLMLRLFANITAGHIVVLSFVGLIFIFGKLGTNLAGIVGGAVISIPLTMFIMAIELLVAFIQAYVFTLLAASYLGAATEEAHH
jgi:F-type H+-transporting ATPase subunit a